MKGQGRRYNPCKKQLIKGEKNQRSGRQPTERKYLQITYLLRGECPEHVRTPTTQKQQQQNT